MTCKRELVHIKTENGETDRLKWVLDYNMPILTENRGYLQEYIRKQVYENL